MKKSFGAIMAATALSFSVPLTAAQQPAPQEQPADAAELAEAHAIIEVIYPSAQRQQMMDKMMADVITPIRQSFPKAAMEDPGLKSIVDDFIGKSLTLQRAVVQKHMPALFEAMAVAYTHEFSLSELKEVHEFAQTKTGGHYLSRSSAMIGDPAVMKVNAALFADAQATSNVLLPKLEEAITAYLTDHPDLATKMGSKT